MKTAPLFVLVLSVLPFGCLATDEPTEPIGDTPEEEDADAERDAACTADAFTCAPNQAYCRQACAYAFLGGCSDVLDNCRLGSKGNRYYPPEPHGNYSLRCVPAVKAACHDQIAQCRGDCEMDP